jgi:hypothetical protein
MFIEPPLDRLIIRRWLQAIDQRGCFGGRVRSLPSGLAL